MDYLIGIPVRHLGIRSGAKVAHPVAVRHCATCATPLYKGRRGGAVAQVSVVALPQPGGSETPPMIRLHHLPRDTLVEITQLARAAN